MKVAELCNNFQFPPLKDDDELDILIKDCWHGKYESIKALSEHVATIAPVEKRQGTGAGQKWLLAQESVCKEISNESWMQELINQVRDQKEQRHLQVLKAI